MSINEKLDQAISDAFAEDSGGFVTGFFAVVEGVDGDGDHWLRFFHSDGARTWHVRGWLHEALTTQTVGQLEHMLDEEE